MLINTVFRMSVYGNPQWQSLLTIEQHNLAALQNGCKHLRCYLLHCIWSIQRFLIYWLAHWRQNTSADGLASVTNTPVGTGSVEPSSERYLPSGSGICWPWLRAGWSTGSLGSMNVVVFVAWSRKNTCKVTVMHWLFDYINVFFLEKKHKKVFWVFASSI